MKNKWIKNLIVIVIAIVLSLAVQTGIMIFVKNYYIDSTSEAEIKDITSSISNSKKELSVNIPDNASYILPSNNGRYLLYVVGEEAHVINFEDGKDTTLDMIVDSDNTKFCWHDTEEKLIISQTNENGVLGLNMYTYSPKIGTVQRALNAGNEARTYYLNNWNERVSDIKINNVTTILYLKIDTGYSSWINRLNISEDSYKLKLISNNIGEYRILKSYDKIVYEDLNSDKIYISDKIVSTEIKIDGVEGLKLLGLENNILYLGKSENDMITSIYSMDVSKDYNENGEWKEKVLDEPVNSDNIIISKNGQVYINSDLEGTVTNLNTSKKTEYDGKFITVVKDKVISKEENTIYRLNLN